MTSFATNNVLRGSVLPQGLNRALSPLSPPMAPGSVSATAVSPAVVWRDSYCTGNHRIDREHQAMFALVNTIQAALERGESMLVLCGLLDQLAQQSSAHFSNEEALMLRLDYPGYDRHKQIHDSLVKKVKNLLADMQECEVFKISDLVMFLAEWLSHHIKGEDQKMAMFFKQHLSPED